MENTLRNEKGAQPEIIRAEPCGINRTLYLDKVHKYEKPVLPGEAYNHDDVRRLAGLPVQDKASFN